MKNIRFINFCLVLTIFLLIISWGRLILVYFLKNNYIFVTAQQSQCYYLKWQGTFPEGGSIPQSIVNSSSVIASPIRVDDGGGVVISSNLNPDPMFRVVGSSSLNIISSSKICLAGVCRSNWPAGSGSDYWLFNSSQNFLYPSSSNWSVSIGTSSLSVTIPTSSLYVMGNVISQGGFLGTINAINVSAGTFGSSTGGGNFTFPANLTVKGTSTAKIFVGDILKANDRICIGSDCLAGWPDKSVSLLHHFINGHLFKATTSWDVYPISNLDVFKRDNKFLYPYISFKDIVFVKNIATTSPTTTEWFDLAYGYVNIDDTRFYRALYVEESDNSLNLNRYSVSTSSFFNDNYLHGRLDANDRFAWGDYYDQNGALKSTTSEQFLFTNCRDWDDGSDGCKGMAVNTVAFYRAASTRHGRIVLELRVVPWKKSVNNECDFQEYNLPGMRLAMWRRPQEIAFIVNPFNKAENNLCTGASLRAKIQGRFIVREIEAPPDSLHDTKAILGPSPLINFSTLTDENGTTYEDFYFVFKSLGLAVVYNIRN